MNPNAIILESHELNQEIHATKKRRSHRKSRTGCRNCKNRKVKCDEAKPVCGGCIRFALPCSFDSASSRSPPHPDHPFFRNKRGRPRKDWIALANASDTDRSESGSSPAATVSQTSLPALNVDDLELLHHFMTDPVLNSGNENLWRKKILPLGFEHYYVMHLVLAFAALHLATIHPSESTRYEELANNHSVIGLRMVTEVLPNLNEDNCIALYFATTLVCFTTLAKRSTRGHLLVMADGWEVSWWNLFRGVRYIVETMGFEAVFGRLGPSSDSAEHTWPTEWLFINAVYWEEPLGEIADLITQTPAPDRQIYQKSFDDLVKAFRETYGTTENPIVGEAGKFQVVIAWLYQMEDNFSERLKDKQPVALVIMAHFAVLFHTLEYFWCLKGWAERILASIEETLDPTSTHWLRWPMKQVREAESFVQQFTICTKATPVLPL
ncbi:hypothetical protein F5Y02DRAFT_389858 [Annulohypoxylon stygium]|nr:hypothetical protein F5Y02DRAFT_389858 [Annulohypoxylon stygium]